MVNVAMVMNSKDKCMGGLSFKKVELVVDFTLDHVCLPLIVFMTA